MVEKFLVAMAETGFAKRENILTAKAATVTKRSMRTARLSAVRTPENARDDQVICCRWRGGSKWRQRQCQLQCCKRLSEIRAGCQKYHNTCKIGMIEFLDQL